MEKIDAFIINYNGKKTVLETIRSLYDSESVRVNISVLDDCSTDDSVEMIKKAYPGVRVYEGSVNTGKPNILRNRAMAMARTSKVLLTDNDILYEPGCLKELVGGMGQGHGVAAAIPRLMYWNEPERIYLAGSRVHYLATSVGDRRDQLLEKVGGKPETSTGGGIVLLDREKALALGGFDEDYLHGWGEDGEFYQRLMLAGLKSCYVPSAVAYHEAKLNQTRPARAEGQIYNRWQYILTHYSSMTIFYILPALMLYEMIQVLFMVLKKMPRLYLKSTLMAMVNIPFFLEKRRRIQRVKKVADKDLLCSGMIYVSPFLTDNSRILGLGLKMISALFGIYWKLVGKLLP
ncbi:MAG: glycosyltransferase [Desulfobacteraceae bacterium]|nr:glycosyltransferase [Desulfobacteraceae bacterium]